MAGMRGSLSMCSVSHVQPLSVTVVKCDNIVQPFSLVIKKNNLIIPTCHTSSFLILIKDREQHLFTENIAQLRIP